MDFNEFNDFLHKKAAEIKEQGSLDLAMEVESVALRFVDDNFRNEAWEGMPWEARANNVDPGRNLLVGPGSGILRGGFQSEVSAHQVRITNDVPYAGVHNEGFRGVVYVKPHKRYKFDGPRVKKKMTGKYNVRGFGKRMNMPRRQFAPTESRPSPTLNAQVEETSINFLKTFFTP